MGTLASPRNLSYYFKRGNLVSELTRRIFSGEYYHSNTTYYKSVLGQYSNFSSYIGIFKGLVKLSTIHTDVDIQPGILGEDSRSVVTKHGKPDFIFTDKNLSIYIYKWKFNGLKTRCEIHLYNDQAFLVNYIYNQLDKSESDYIVKTITGKYLNKYVSEIDLAYSKIGDRNNNVLMVEDFLMGLKVTYMSNSESDWYEKMISEMNARKASLEAKVRIGERRLYNKL